MYLPLDIWREVAKHCDFKMLGVLSLVCRSLYNIAFPIIFSRSLIRNYFALKSGVHIECRAVDSFRISPNTVVSYALSGSLQEVFKIYGVRFTYMILVQESRILFAKCSYSEIKTLIKMVPSLLINLPCVCALALFREKIILASSIMNVNLLAYKPEFADWIVQVISKAANRQDMEYYENAYQFHLTRVDSHVMLYGDYESVMQNLARIDANLIKNGILSRDEFNRVVATACYRGIPIPDKNLFRYRPTFADIRDPNYYPGAKLIAPLLI